MTDKLSIFINKITSTRIWYYIENFLIIGLLFYCTKSLIDYDNAFYQVWKNEVGAKAILAFVIIIFIIRKVKLINWQSLIATLVFCIFLNERLHFWSESPDILLVVKYQMATEWLTLMIIIDMILYKEINNIFTKFNPIVFLYIATTFGMIWRRNGVNDPIILIFPFILFSFVKMETHRLEWLIRRFIDSWFITYIYICIKSFIENPYTGGRYYGCFLNIGAFGIFVSCSLVIAIVAFIFSQKNNPHTPICIMSILWILSCIYMLWIINTITSFIGVFFTFAFIFLFVRKNTNAKSIIMRIVIILGLISFIVAICYIALRALSNPVLYEELSSGNSNSKLLSPINNALWRFYSSSTFCIDTSKPLSHQLLTIIDNLSSGRISIAKEYAKYFNYDGNGPLSLSVNIWDYDYWAFNPHNQYIQFIVEYGYISFIEIISLILLSFSTYLKKYLKDKKDTISLLSLLWLSNMLGVWLGEGSSFFYPVTFFGIFFITLLMQYSEKDKSIYQ